MSALACRDNNLLSQLVQDLMFMAKKTEKRMIFRLKNI